MELNKKVSSLKLSSLIYIVISVLFFIPLAFLIYTMFTIANYSDVILKEKEGVAAGFALAFYLFCIGIPYAIYSIIFFLIKIFKKRV